MARFSDSDHRQHEWYVGLDWPYEWDTCRCCERAYDVSLLVGRYCAACRAGLEADRREGAGR
jgi:hypothetical protein